MSLESVWDGVLTKKCRFSILQSNPVCLTNLSQNHPASKNIGAVMGELNNGSSKILRD